MIETPGHLGEPPQTVETTPALARMDGFAQGRGAQEILLFEVGSPGQLGSRAGRHLPEIILENLFRQGHFRDAAS